MNSKIYKGKKATEILLKNGTSYMHFSLVKKLFGNLYEMDGTKYNLDDDLYLTVDPVGTDGDWALCQGFALECPGGGGLLIDIYDPSIAVQITDEIGDNDLENNEDVVIKKYQGYSSKRGR